MRLEQLEYLILTAECHSMSKASSYLHVSQQTISKSICDLEKELGLVLFERTSHGVFLTEEGEQIFKLSQEVFERTKKIKTLYDFNKLMDTYHFFEGVFPVLCIPGYNLFVYSIFNSMSQYCPKVTFSLIESESLHLLNRLEQSDYEFAFTTAPKDLSSVIPPSIFETYDIFLFHNDCLKVLTTLSSPLLQFQTISDKQLANYPLVNYRTSEEIETLIDKVLMDRNISFRKVIECNNPIIYTEALTKQNAIAISSDFIFKSSMRNNTNNFVLLPMTTKIPIVHLYLKKKKLSALGQLFDRILTNKLEGFNVCPKQIPEP